MEYRSLNGTMKDLSVFIPAPLSGTDAKLAETAAVSLFLFYLAKEDYEKAEEFLNRLPKGGNQYRQFHAILCQRQGNLSMAYSLYEQNALTAYSDLNSSLYGIIGMAIAENNMKKAETVAEKLSGLARLMEMGPYMELSPGLGSRSKIKIKKKLWKFCLDWFKICKISRHFKNPNFTAMFPFPNFPKTLLAGQHPHSCLLLKMTRKSILSVMQRLFAFSLRKSAA